MPTEIRSEVADQVRPVHAAVDLGAISSNVAALIDCAGVPVCAVVKADAYGHGAVPVARAALAGGAEMLAVALVAEGVELREAAVGGPVMVLSQACDADLPELVAADLEATVYTHDGIESLRCAAAAAGRGSTRPVGVHLKIDTGMHRVGAEAAAAVTLARMIDGAPELRLASVFTHLAVADEPDDPFTGRQIDEFRRSVADIEAAGIEVPLRHAANTAGAIAHPDSRFDMVRCGIGIYGIAPGPQLAGRADAPALRPAMSLVAEVSHAKRVPAGARISYGRRYEAPGPTTIATVPLGYADGVVRALGARGGEVLIGGERHRIAGTVTMDQILVDCGDAAVAVGDEVVLLGSQGGEQVTAEEWADLVGTIGYEIVCGIGARVPRRYFTQEDR